MMSKQKLQIDKSKTTNLNAYLDDTFGKKGTKTREEFAERAYAFYYGEILKDRRKELNLTQEELAQKVGKPRPYISQIENGQDIKLSSLIIIAKALGLSLSLEPNSIV